MAARRGRGAYSARVWLPGGRGAYVETPVVHIAARDCMKTAKKPFVVCTALY